MSTFYSIETLLWKHGKAHHQKWTVIVVEAEHFINSSFQFWLLLLYGTIYSMLSTPFLYRIMIVKLKYRKSFLFLTSFTMFPGKSFRTCASILIGTIHACGTVGTIVRETIVDLCKTGYKKKLCHRMFSVAQLQTLPFVNSLYDVTLHMRKVLTIFAVFSSKSTLTDTRVAVDTIVARGTVFTGLIGTVIDVYKFWWQVMNIIIQWTNAFFFVYISLAHHVTCIMVCSCVIPSKRFLLQITLCSSLIVIMVSPELSEMISYMKNRMIKR